MSQGVELVPRNYQDELIRICVKQNSIIFLPTGAGKTFTAVCAIKQLIGEDFSRTYSEGGKICVILVNTVTLVGQHKKYVEQNSPYTVGGYTGALNVDFWSREKWLEEYNNHNVIIMTAQIFRNCLTANIIDLNKVNVMVFDECHHGVDNHPMREIMYFFKDLTDPPRVIGLTATLLNGNVKPTKVLEEVIKLETTFHAKVATVDALMNVVGYSTNPREEIVGFKPPVPLEVIDNARSKLDKLETLIRAFKPAKKAPTPHNMDYLNKEKPFEKYYKLLMDAKLHLEMLGVGGARIACVVYQIHMELEKRSCSDSKTLAVINAMITLFNEVKFAIEPVFQTYPSELRTLLLSSSKVQKLVQTLMGFRHYAVRTNQELCGIVFVERKNTALLLYHILTEIKANCPDMGFIKPDFIIGNTANPLNSTTEALYYAKLNRKIMDKFNSKEVNLLIASNVIEEGVDVQMCSLVIKFDVVKDYRAYIQSKGRARHAASKYYVMVEDNQLAQFHKKYCGYQSIERDLNEYLIGSNENRAPPDQEKINSMYNETNIFYVDGPGSANITESAAVSLIMMYCSSVKADIYTRYEPVFLVEHNGPQLRVHVELPTFSTVRDRIPGEWRATKKDAKNSAAFKACIALYKAGELTDEMLPNPAQSNNVNLDFLFTHWPEGGNKADGVSKKTRPYNRRIPRAVGTPVLSNKDVYLHIIDMEPLLGNEFTTLKKMYANDLRFGFVTAEKLPELCAFPTFVTLGQISVTVNVNQKAFVLSEQQISLIKRFHHLVFNGVLGILSRKEYLILGDNRPMYSYLVPVHKSTKTIDFGIVAQHENIVDVSNELTTDEKLNLIVNNETYFEKIVTPTYRDTGKHHLVMEVCDYLTAESQFPNNEFRTFADYYECKYAKVIVNKGLPMLSVKPLSKSMNCLKPSGLNKKRKREESFEMFVQHFSPELCVKQEFPAPLWVSAVLLPTVLRRVEHFLIADELRTQIALDTKLGSRNVQSWEPLMVDSRVIKYESNVADESIRKDESQVDDASPKEMKAEDISNMIGKCDMNKTFNAAMLDAQYPWEAEKEPVDCWRHLNATVLDIELFSKFMHTNHEDNNTSVAPARENTRAQSGRLAINYTPPDYKYQGIKLVSQRDDKGPELRSVYEALTTSKAFEVVNLERLETLGDSFLKLAASLYVFNRFPNFSEGQATELKGKLVSNRNLFYLAQKHGVGGLILNSDFQPNDEWLPPGYCTPKIVQDMIQQREASIGSLFNIMIPPEEQLSGDLSQETVAHIMEIRNDNEEETIDSGYASMCHYLGTQMIGDKTLADVIEAIIGVYVEAMGLRSGMKIMQWLGILPYDALKYTFDAPTPNPIIKEGASARDVVAQLSNTEASQIENILGYRFNNRGFLLQALTHASYNSNRLTLSYQRLEFIGDAVLDLLITFFIFENNTQLNPGQLTDLRSALVNNETFAAYVIKLKLHKYLKHYNTKLTSVIAKFEAYQAIRKDEITSDVLLLLNEDNLQLGENIDVPKVLGDLFESIIGAIFLDCGKDFETVWTVIHRIMWKELDSFSKDIPINPVRSLYETLAPLKPRFHDPIDVDGSRIMMKLDFHLDGSLTRVYGFGDNKVNAKKAAAKLALRLLNFKRK